MSKDNNLHDFLQDVADAIKEKKGSNDAINAQDFSDEIKNLPSGSSPFAVDFGEEIATGNPAFIGALQEDIDYYNEVKAKLASGEETINKMWQNKEFQRRIAWIPPEMLNSTGLAYVSDCKNLCIYPYEKLYSDMYNKIPYMKRLRSLSANASEVTRFGNFLNSGYVRDVDLSFPKVTKSENSIFSRMCGESIKLDFPLLTNVGYSNFNSIRGVRYMELNFPLLTTFPSSTIRDCFELEELHLNIPSVTTQSYSVYNNPNLRICHLKGMQCSFNIDSSVLEIESVKYMLDNCQQRADGASYILTLNSAVKTAFLAKCDEDAEYAASLASANAKGLTLA